MKQYAILIIALLVIVGTASATSFSNWQRAGDAWYSYNDTYSAMMWNDSGTHYWLSDGNASSVQYIVVAGGGGGGSAYNAASGGGGGAGGILNGTGLAVSGVITINVGSGGAGGYRTGTGVNGTNSSFGAIEAKGGGGGGGGNVPSAFNGGSGGGAGNKKTAGSGTTGQGSNGGSASGYGGAAGGGGANAVGGSTTTQNCGAGGAGRTFTSMPGITLAFAGGGAGGWDYNGACSGGVGGGGSSGASASPGTGGGGGGGPSNYAIYYPGGDGATGAVVVIYQSPVVLAPTADFTCNLPRHLTVNNATIQCNSSYSSGFPTSWYWEWGDGGTSTIQNPSHVYNTMGSYQINLRVTNSNSTSWLNRTAYVNVSETLSNWASEGDHWRATSGRSNLTALMWNSSAGQTSSWVADGNATGSVDYVIVAGGGGGGGGASSKSGGGGGAGGLLYGWGYPVSGTIAITVGAGGIGGTTAPTAGTSGGNSIFSGITATGGGGGGANGAVNGLNGGSGGGAAYNGANGTGINGQGFYGGFQTSGGSAGGGGGGGNSSYGLFSQGQNCGGGGAGRSIYAITGVLQSYSGGGAGGWDYNGGCSGGLGGGGATNTPGTNSTGGGGGAGQSNGGSYPGKNGGSGLVMILFEPAPYTTPVVSFTCSPLSTTKGYPITCNDSSTQYPLTWYWDWGDGTNSTTQNPIHYYATPGTYDVNLTATNEGGSGYLNKASYITIGNLTGLVQQDIWMYGRYVITFHVISSTGGTPIMNAIVVDNSGQSANTSITGNANITEDSGTILVNVAATGYYPRTLSYVVDRDETHTIQLTPEIPNNQQKQNTLYPHETRFICVDRFGNRLSGLQVTARMDNSTLLGNWLESLFGVSSQTSPSLNETMSGETDSYGSIVFPVISSGRYTMTFTGSTIVGGTTTKTIYPDEGTTTIILATTNSQMTINKWDYVTGNLSTFVPNSSWVFLNLSYRDTSLSTTSVTFYVNYPNQTAKYVKVFPATPPSINQTINTSYAVSNVKGDAYVWGWFSNSTFGNSSGSQGITMSGPSGILIDVFSPRTGWD